MAADLHEVFFGDGGTTDIPDNPVTIGFRERSKERGLDTSNITNREITERLGDAYRAKGDYSYEEQYPEFREAYLKIKAEKGDYEYFTTTEKVKVETTKKLDSMDGGGIASGLFAVCLFTLAAWYARALLKSKKQASHPEDTPQNGQQKKNILQNTITVALLLLIAYFVASARGWIDSNIFGDTFDRISEIIRRY